MAIKILINSHKYHDQNLNEIELYQVNSKRSRHWHSTPEQCTPKKNCVDCGRVRLTNAQCQNIDTTRFWSSPRHKMTTYGLNLFTPLNRPIDFSVYEISRPLLLTDAWIFIGHLYRSMQLRFGKLHVVTFVFFSEICSSCYLIRLLRASSSQDAS